MKHKEGDIVLYIDKNNDGTFDKVLYELKKTIIKNKKNYFWHFMSEINESESEFFKLRQSYFLYSELSKISFYYTTKGRKLLIEKTQQDF